MTQRCCFYPLCVLLLMILLYMGQSIFQATWMYMGLGSALMLILHIKTLPCEQRNHITTLSFMALIVYQLHQFEEHGIDLLGQYYALGPYVNHIMGAVMGCPIGMKDCPLNVENIFYTNMLMVWFPLLISGYLAEKRPMIASCFISIIPANALIHILVGLIQQEYNPGLFTAIMLFLPFSFFYYKKLLSEKRLTHRQLFFSFLYGLIGHPFIMLALVSSYVNHAYSTDFYPLVLSLYVLTPVLLSQLKCCCCPKGCKSCKDCGGCSGCCGCGCKISACTISEKEPKTKPRKAIAKPVARAKKKRSEEE